MNTYNVQVNGTYIPVILHADSYTVRDNGVVLFYTGKEVTNCLNSSSWLVISLVPPVAK
jgi:hypothetical protein